MKDTVFFKDSLCSLSISWEQLLNNLNKKKLYNPYCKSSSFYEIFEHIILSMLLGEEIILLDGDFSEQEIEALVGQKDTTTFDKPVSSVLSLSTSADLITKISSPASLWKITLFTSGTTGLPKKVSHTFSSITRFVRKGDAHLNAVWGFAYNPTHMAGLQVLFQALLNGNTIIRLFQLPRDLIIHEILVNKITNISATPTFYRLLMPPDFKLPSVQRITSGGEKFDKTMLGQLSIMFPNAKITNVYASTEAGTLFASVDDAFSVKKDFASFVKIENNELYIHQSLLGQSEQFQNEWYCTGDLVETVSQTPLTFRFVSRKDEMINVGGYKVNPNEVEEAIRRIDGVADVRVYSKSNSVLGNIICCEVARLNPELTEPLVRTELQKSLQEFKIPRLVTFVEKVQVTRTGKIKRS